MSVEILAELPDRPADVLFTNAFKPLTNTIEIDWNTGPDQEPDISAAGEQLTKHLDGVGGWHIGGIIFKSQSVNHNRALYIPSSYEQYEAGYTPGNAPLTIEVKSNYKGEIRHATHASATSSRLDEITGAYILPNKYRNPQNSVDAAIGYIVGKFAGIENPGKSIEDIEKEVVTPLINGLDELSSAQRFAFESAATLNISNSFENQLSKSHKLTALEQVLRVLLYQQTHRWAKDAFDCLGADYTHCTGKLGEAIYIINGRNSVSRQVDPSNLTLGLFPQKSSVTVSNKATYITDPTNPNKLRPIWPPEEVEAYDAELKAAQQAREEQARIQAEAREAQRLLRQQEAEQAEVIRMERFTSLKDEVTRLVESGYTWHGILSTKGPLNDPRELDAFIRERYPEKEYVVIPRTALDSAGRVQFDDHSVTIFTK